MSKYTPLGTRLREQSGNSIILTFTEIENIIGDELPPSARDHFISWDNIHGSLQNGWRDVGWRTIMVDLENKRVKFQRLGI